MDHESITIVAVTAVLGFLATLTVLFRFWARHLKHQSLGADDFLIVVALLFTWGVCVIDIVSAVWARVGEHEIYGTGKEAGIPLTWEIHRESIALYSMEILHTCAMPAIKLYTLAFYRRIFVSRAFRIAINVVGVYVLGWWIGVLFATIFQCIPVGSVWSSGSVAASATCIDVYTYAKAAAVLNVISDFAVILLPIPMILKLKMPSQDKVAVIGIFLTSSIVIVAAIERTVSYFDVSRNYDYSWHDYYLLIWTSIEPCMGVIGACLPSLRPCFHGMSPESVIGSIRSVMSLRSLRSQASKGSMQQGGTKEEEWQQLQDDLHTDVRNGKHEQSWEVGRAPSQDSVPSGKIQIQRGFEMDERPSRLDV